MKKSLQQRTVANAPSRASDRDDLTGSQNTMQSKRHRLIACAALAYGLVTALSACSSADDELDRFIDDTKKQPGGRVQPLPEVKPYETFVYADVDKRSPFAPSVASGTGPNAGLRPDSKRNREFLEQFSLDTLKMVGTLHLGNTTYG